jgi:hypothetical protein
MRRIPLASLILLAGLVRAAEVAPFEVPATPPGSGSIDATNGVVIKTAESAKRVVSPKTAAKLGAATPQFQAVNETMAPTKFELPADMVPAQASASPIFRTGIETRHPVVQLPRFIVQEPKLPDPLQVLTTKGREELAFQRRPGCAWCRSRR